ncbi:MAG: hypothetical protein IIY93_04980 [Clostridia bacterium]|nr:hypothetical protein [Clostridia bacterium]MBQ1555149.1 hypothetical protein [Clostridia bacterium]
MTFTVSSPPKQEKSSDSISLSNCASGCFSSVSCSAYATDTSSDCSSFAMSVWSLATLPAVKSTV